MIDTHAHLSWSSYEKDLDQIIKRSLEKGVDKIICLSSNIEESKKSIEISRQYPGIVYPAVGIHPQQTDPNNNDSLEKQISQLKQLAEEKEIVAIGEAGLDYSPAPPPEKDRSKKEQHFLFQEQIQLAEEKGLPLIVHSRQAFEETLSLISPYQGRIKGVFHCYSGGKRRIEAVRQLGFFFGVDGNLTYDQGLQNVFQQIGLEETLLETDSPLLTPLPHRGERNEPSYTIFIAQKLAEIKGVNYQQVDQTTTSNAIKLFQFK